MSVTSFATDDLFIVRVIKSLTTNPDNRWANSYEFRATEAGSETTLLALASALVNFEKALHLVTVNFEALVVSTWEPDSVPYDPAAFLSSTLSAVGTRSNGSPPIGLGQTFSVARDAASGRKGHLFYRGVLTESDVEAPAGKSVLTSRSDMQDEIDAALGASDMGDYIGASPSGGLQLVLINADGDQIRPVIQLRAQGVSSVPEDHAWFNRSSIVVP